MQNHQTENEAREIQMPNLIGKIFSIFNLIIIAVMIYSLILYAENFEDQFYTSTQ